MNSEHVAIVKSGSAQIAEWRNKNPDKRLDLTGASFNGAILNGANLSGANLYEAILNGADLTEANLEETIACGAKLSKAELSEASLKNADLREVSLIGAKLSKANFLRANLHRANLEEANLQKAILEGAILERVNLVRANLNGANLNGANLIGATLNEATLQGASLQGATLDGANLIGVNLQDANLEFASLASTNLSYCNFKNTITSGIRLSESLLGDIDLFELLDDGITHERPSIVDLQSLRKLNGRIDSNMEKFLRRLGMDRWEVEIARTYDTALGSNEISEYLYKAFDRRTTGAIYLGGVFISYAHANVEFADKLFYALEKKEITVYLDRHDFTAGSIEKNISRAIRINDQVVLVLSEDALNSDWVWDEIASTLEKEKALDKDVLFPICVDDSWKADQRNKRRLMRQIEERVILDFSKPEDFESNLRKLITGMKVNQ